MCDETDGTVTRAALKAERYFICIYIYITLSTLIIKFSTFNRSFYRTVAIELCATCSALACLTNQSSNIIIKSHVDELNKLDEYRVQINQCQSTSR